MTSGKRIGLWLALAIVPLGAAVGQEEPDAEGPPLEGPPVPEDRKVTPLVGQVLNHLGGGVQGAAVTLRLKGPPDAEDKLLDSTQSDQIGDFEIHVPPGTKGTVVLVIKQPGFAAYRKEYEATKITEEDFVEALLKGSETLLGLVVRAGTNEPIAGAEVQATAGGRMIKAVSGPDGRFAVDGLPPSGGRLTVEAEGFGKESQPIDPAAMGTPTTIALKKERVLHLRIVDEKNKPIEGVTVELMTDRGDNRTEPTGPDGRLAIRRLSQDAKSLRVRLTHDDYVKTGRFDDEIVPDDGELAPRVTLSMQRGGTVALRIVGAEDEPLFGARVIGGIDEDAYVPVQFSDFDGKAALTGLPKGKTVITVHHAFHAPYLLDVNVVPGTTARRSLKLEKGGAIAGTIVDPDGEALPNILVASAGWKGYNTLRIGAMTDEDGTFEIDNAPSGEIRFALSHANGGEFKEVLMSGGKTDYRFTIDPNAAPPAAPGGAPPVAPGQALAANTPAPDFAVTTLTGQQLTRKDLAGKFVFLDFWATWCPPCVAEVPVLKRLHAATKDRDDFILLSISLDAKRSDVERFIKKNGVTWHQAVGETAGAHRAAAAFQVSAIPATFLIGPDGKLVATGLRGEGLVEAVQQYLKPAK